MTEGPPLEPADFDRLAALHRASLRDSPLGQLGPSIVRRYYVWAAGSRDEHVLVARDAGGVIQGGAVVSASPETVLRRFAMSTIVRFAATVLVRFAADRVFRQQALAFAAEALRPGRPPDSGPELLQIFVDAGHQNQALGRGLLKAIEELLLRRGDRMLRTRTHLEDNEAALAFYRRCGFESVGETTFCGRAYVLLRRALPTTHR